MAYGVDANGNPQVGNDSPSTSGPAGANQCNTGYHWDDSQGCVPNNQTTQQPQAGQPQQGPGTTAPQQQTPAQPTNPLFQGMDPRLTSLFQQYGQTPTGQGTGNTDIAYWNSKLTAPGADANYYLGRLGSDFAGNGPDKGGGGQGAQMASFLGGPTTPPPPNFTPGTAPTTTSPTYNPTQFTQPGQFTPDASQGQMGQLIQQLLASGGSMGPAQVAQMRAGQQDTITSASDAAKQNILASAAMRGTSPGGSTGAQLAGVDMSTQGNLSKAYRDIDTNAAQTNFANQMSSIGAASGFQSQLLDQYLKQNTQNLQTQQAQAGENQFGYGANRQGQQDTLNNWLATQGFGLNASQTQFANWLQSQGLNLSYSQLAEASRQFNMGNQLDVAKFLGS